MKERWLKRIVRALAAIAIVIVLIAAAVQTPPAQRFAFNRLRNYLRLHSGIELQASDIHLNYFKGSASLENLTIRSTRTPDLPPIFRTARVFAQISIVEALRGSWVIRELVLERPEIHYFVTAQGQNNIPRAAPSSGPPPEVLILHAEINNGTFRLQDLQKNIGALFPRWRLAIEGNTQTRAHRIALTNQQPAGVQYKTASIPIRSLSISAELRKNVLQIQTALIEAAGSAISLKGTLVDFSKPSIDLQASPDLDLGQISRIAGLKEIIPGNLSGSLHVTGTLDHIQIAARIKGSKISFKSYRQTGFALNTQGEWLRTEEKLLIPDFSFTSSEGFVAGNAVIYPSGKSGITAIIAKVRNLNLLPLWKLLAPPFDLASRASGNVALQWRGAFDLHRISANAQLSLAATRAVPEHNLLPLSGTIDARLEADRLIGNVHSLKAMGAETNGQFSLQAFRNMAGSFQGSSPNIDNVIQQLSRFLGGSDPSPLGTTLTSPMQFNVQAGGTLKQPVITARIETPALELGSFRHLSAQSNALLQNSRIEFQSTIALPQNATVVAQGNLDYGGSETLLNVDAKTERTPASAIAAMLDSSIPATGNVKATMHIQGPLDNLAGNATVIGDGLSLHNEPVGQLEANLLLSDKKIRSTRFQITRNPKDPATDILEAEFVYATHSEEFQIRATGKDLTLKQSASPEREMVQGTMNLQLSGDGTFEQPSINLRLESDNLRIKQTQIGPVALTASLINEAIQIQAQAPRLNLSAAAQGINRSPYPFTAEANAARTDLSVFGIALKGKQSLAGVLEGTVKGSGNLQDLKTSVLSARIQDLKLRAGDLEIHTQKPVELEYRNNAIEILPTVTLASGRSAIELSGRMPLREPAPKGSLKLKGNIDLAEAMMFIPVPAGFSLAGMMNLEFAISASPRAYGSEGKITLENASIQIPKSPLPLNDVNILAEVQNGALVLRKASAAWGQGRIALTGEFPFSLLPKGLPIEIPRKDGPAKFTLDLENLTPEMTGMFPPEITGRLSLSATGKADRLDLQALNAQILFRELGFKVGTLGFNQKDSSRIDIRNGVASVSQLTLVGPETGVSLGGSVGLYPNGAMNLHLAGTLDAALLTFASQDLKAAGVMKVQIAAGGHLRTPSLSGYVDMDNGRLSLRDPRIQADGLKVRLMLSPEQISIREFAGILNGGTMNVEGAIGYRHGLYNDIHLKATLQDCYLNVPEGLKSASSGTLAIDSKEDAILISGNVRILESSYRESIEVGGQLMNYLKAQQVVVTDQEPNPFLGRIRMDISVRTVTPLLLQNNIARVEASASNLRLVGSFYEPSVVGRITLNEGGELVLNQQTYYINRGVITLVNQNRIEPELNIQAQTKVSNYEITLQLMGNPERLTTTLSSEPPMSERDILSLLLTGKTASETQGREMQMVRTQALSLLAGQAGEQVTGEARKALHLSTFRIDPGLIASESDPGARLTIGEDITRNFSLAYSMNLVNGGDQIWAAQYNILRRLTTQATKQQDNTYRFEFRHDLRFGGATSTRTTTKPAASKFDIGSIQFQGGMPFSEKTLAGQLGIEPGDRYDFPKIQKGLDRLHQFYFNQNHLEADIRMQRETQPKTVDLKLTVKPGPVVSFAFEGAPVSDRVKANIKKAWSDGIFETERIEDAVLVIRRALTQDGFLQAEITPEVETTEERKQIVFRIVPGPRYAQMEISFPGASQISADQLRTALNLAGMNLDIHVNARRAVEYLKRYYQDRGYLQAQIAPPQLRLDSAAGRGQVSIGIKEGPLFTIGDLEFSGNHAFSYDEIWMVIPTSSGSGYDPNTLRNAAKAIENLYHSKGYNDAAVAFRVIQNTPKAQANLTFQITERRQSFIRDVIIEGNRDTSQNFVIKQLDFQKGDVLDFQKINESRRRLYATGVYTSVDFQTEEISASNPDSMQKNMRVRIRLRENRPYRLQYGLFYDTERGLGGLLEAQNMNVLGRASNLGLRLRYDTDLKEARVYYNQPFIRLLHFKLDASAFVQEETRSTYRAKRIGFSLIQERSLPKEYRLDYGYRYDHVRWEPKDVALDPTIFQADVPVARLIGTLTRDTRDNVLDATRGEFTAHSIEFGPHWLGSEIGFARYSGQYFRYVPLDKYLGRTVKDKEGRPLPKKFIYAGAMRLGLTSPFGGKNLESPERFFAGGGTTMRGFEQDLLGPTELQPDGSLRPKGGAALFLFNNEIRFPIYGILHGVGFLDVGNVYPKISDFNFNLRKSAGAGLRLKIKYIPLRFDYGFKLDRRTGESSSEYFFSIGQAF